MKTTIFAVAALALLLCAPRSGDALTACRQTGHPCEGNQDCCSNLICVATQPGAAKRCTACPTGQIPCGNACIPACTPSDQCHDAGVCNATTGSCTNLPKTDGSSCDDGNACTQTDTCVAGRCTGGNAVVCNASDQCHDAGTCESSTGSCSNPAKPDGVGCNADSDACTPGDSCQNGVCTAGSATTCNVCNACSSGSCQPVASDSACANGCCNGQCCAAGEQCVDGACQQACLDLAGACVTNSQCCQSLTAQANCAPAAPNCYATGTEPFNQCCRGTQGSCNNDCECCGLQLCEGSKCCKVPGGSCNNTSDCCSGTSTQTCSNGKCCVVEGYNCEEDGDCCAGTCGPDGFCQGCLELQQGCDTDDNQCCFGPGQQPTNCDEVAFGSDPTCCRPSGGACNENDDCCRGGTCCNGACCAAGSECVDNSCQEACLPDGYDCTPGGTACCAGFACRAKIPFGSGYSCQDASCAGPLDGCIEGARCCSGDDDCIFDGLGHHCCSSAGGECDDLGRFFPGGDCCPGTVCNGQHQCAPCRTAGETCDGDGVHFSNCCNTAFAIHPLLCVEGTCQVCPASGEPCVDFGDGPTCCNGQIQPCAGGICR